MTAYIRNWGPFGPGTAKGRYHTTRGQLFNGIPVGILQLWAHLPFFPGNVSNAWTYDFPVRFLEVKGAEIDNVLSGDMELAGAIVEAAKRLEAEGCRVVCANCGFFGHYQKIVADQMDIPVFLSSMVQVPIALAGLRSSKRLGIMTADKASLTDSLFEACMISEAQKKRCIVYGAADKEEFSHILTGEGGLDFDILGDELSEIAHRMMDEHPDIGALLLECTDMPPYAYRLQAELNIPVYDAITLIRYANSIVTHMPYNGFL